VTPRRYLRAVALVAGKDLRAELRTKRVLGASLAFALLVVVAFSFTFVRAVESLRPVAHGALWLSFLFAGTLATTRAAAVEARDGALEGLLLAPVDRSAVYLGKVLSTTLFVAAVELVSLAGVVVFLDYAPPAGALVAVAAVLVLAAAGFAATGVTLSLVASRSGLSGTLVPVLLFPLVVPLLLSGVELTRALVGGRPVGGWARILLGYDAVLLLACALLFEYVVEG